jgi:hypothetical protein
VVLLVMAGSTLLGWAVIVAGPIVATSALCIGPLAAMAFAPPTCPRCGAMVQTVRRTRHAA